MRAALSVHAERGSVAVLDPAGIRHPLDQGRGRRRWRNGARRSRPWSSSHAEETGAVKSFRNIDRVTVAEVGAIGVADVIGAASLVVSEAALEKLKERLS